MPSSRLRIHWVGVRVMFYGKGCGDTILAIRNGFHNVLFRSTCLEFEFHTNALYLNHTILQKGPTGRSFPENWLGGRSNEVQGIQGTGPQIVFGGAVSPKSPDHGDHPPPAPPLRIISPPSIN